MTNNIAKIYVLCHKNGHVLDLPPLNFYMMAGNALLQEKCEMPGDDINQNISCKNLYYSELTGIYWIWKNTQHEITGICHYRRFFTAKQEPFLYRIKRWTYLSRGLYRKHFGLIYASNVKLFRKMILTESEMRKLLEQHDAILPIPIKLKKNVENHYSLCHNASDLITLRQIINEKQPDYITAFDQTLLSNKLYANNMFILRKELFEEFMTWWFDVLFEFEQRIDLQTKTGHQQRILGFIAERLLNVWFAHKKLNVVELPIIYFKKFKEKESCLM